MASDRLLACIDTIIEEWNNHFESICFPGFPRYACPIPFFGNIESGSPLVFTIGSNPSNREFVSKNNQALPFRLLDPSREYTSQELFDACCKYFSTNPYYGWFGNKGTKIEGFLNVIKPDASYYGEKSRQAIHLDIMPFPTLAKYSCFKICHHTHIPQMKVLGKILLDILIKEYKPQEIICVGTDSCSEWLSYVGKKQTAGQSFKYFKGQINGVKAFGTSLYYPTASTTTPKNWSEDIVPLM